MTKTEQAMCDGEFGEAIAYAMKIQMKYGKAMQAESLVPVESVHASYTNYRLMSDVGVEWLDDLVALNAKSTIPTTTQATGMDMVRWDTLGFTNKRHEVQQHVCDCHHKMGNAGTYSCAPYLLGHCPIRGSHIVSVESSCIPYMNSVFGARTNRECGQSAILASITGRTPKYGLHITDQRKGDLLVKVETPLKTEMDFSVLGYFAGKIVGLGIPVFDQLVQPSSTQLRALGAGLATSGGVALWHCPGVSAEANSIDDAFQGDKIPETVAFTSTEYQEILDELNQYDTEKVDVVDLGCPHYSATDIHYVASLLEGKKFAPNVEVTIWTAQAIRHIAERNGDLAIIQAAGGEIYTDTCPLGIPRFRGKALATNSTKQANYAASVLGGAIFLGSVHDCINAALTGKWET